jgi:hypothetical protein
VLSLNKINSADINFVSLKNIIPVDNDRLITEHDHFADIACLINVIIISVDIDRRISEKIIIADIDCPITEQDHFSCY